MGRARTALVGKVNETYRATGVMTLAQIAALLARDTERDDRAARRLAELLPEGMAESPFLEDGALAEWIDLLVRTEKMDQLLGGRLGMELSGEDVPRPVDGATRLGALRAGTDGLET